jgi:hypothetical protein
MRDLPDARIQALVDQLLAAHREVTGAIGWVAPGLRGWEVDESTTNRVDAMLSWALSQQGRSDRICPHAWASLIGGAPRPQVLDAGRGILACLDGCYVPRVLAHADGPHGAVVRCFDCGGSLGTLPLDNLLIAYGPVLVVESRCGACDRNGG